MGPEDPRPGTDWHAFRAARDRFFAKVRPEAMDDPPELVCPDSPPKEWTSEEAWAPGEDAADTPDPHASRTTSKRPDNPARNRREFMGPGPRS